MPQRKRKAYSKTFLCLKKQTLMSKVKYNYSKHYNNIMAYVFGKTLTVKTGSSVEAETSYPPARLSIINN